MATIADLDSIAFEHFTWGDLRRSLNYWDQHDRYGQERSTPGHHIEPASHDADEGEDDNLPDFQLGGPC